MEYNGNDSLSKWYSHLLVSHTEKAVWLHKTSDLLIVNGSK